jgi:hypothetical protein
MRDILCFMIYVVDYVWRDDIPLDVMRMYVLGLCCEMKYGKSSEYHNLRPLFVEDHTTCRIPHRPQRTFQIEIINQNCVMDIYIAMVFNRENNYNNNNVRLGWSWTYRSIQQITDTALTRCISDHSDSLERLRLSAHCICKVRRTWILLSD